MSNLLSYVQEVASAVMYAAEATELETVLERIAEAAREIVQTKYAALGIPDGRGGLRYFKTAGISKEYAERMGPPPSGHGLIGAIMRERRVIRLEHMKSDPRAVGFGGKHPMMDSFLGVPVAVGPQLYGMLYLCDKINEVPFSDEDQHLVEMIAGYAALAIAGAEIKEQQNRIRLLEERERIGMELHDGIIQLIYGIGMQVDMLRKSGEPVPPQKLDMVVDSLNEVIEDIRAFISNLRRPIYPPVTIRECFHSLRDRLHPPESLAIQIDAPDTVPPFTPAVFESICLIVNEAMSNAIRHADANTIHVQVHVNKRDLLITITDDGKGFEQDHGNHQNGLGLHNMRQRARLYGGDIMIESLPGKGTELKIQIPLRSY